MDENFSNKYRIGIMAYGSLIDEPGCELEPVIIHRISCYTPFPVEYSRLSKTRGNAPTLIPVSGYGSIVKGCILVLHDKVSIEEAMSMLWRRETRKTEGYYERPKKPGNNHVIVESIVDFQECQTVLYTSIGSNISGILNGERLASYALESIASNAGSLLVDGVRYLQAAMANGIQTPLTSKYHAEILRIAECNDLENVVAKMDLKRSLKRFYGYVNNQISINHVLIGEKIERASKVADKLAEFGRHYSFVESRGRVYTMNADGLEKEKIICNCENCKKEPGFNEKYSIYERFLKAEVSDLQCLLSSDLSYSDKLKIFFFLTGGWSPIRFEFAGEQIEVLLSARSAYEIQTQNQFIYGQVLDHFFLKPSSIQKLYQKDYHFRKDQFLARFNNALYKDEWIEKNIRGIKENSDNCRGAESNAIFVGLVDGEIIDLTSRVFEYSEMFNYVVANEDYLFLEFLEGRSYESKPAIGSKIEISVGRIHFEDRSSTEFERLVFAFLLNTENWDSLEWLGETGDDGGRDIWGVLAGETYCYQCANYKLMRLGKATEDIDKLVKDGRIPKNWILYCGGRISNPVRESIKSYGNRAGIRNINTYTGAEFEEALRRRTPSLIKRFVEGEIFPEPDIPDFNTINTSPVGLVKSMLADWLYHEIFPSILALRNLYDRLQANTLDPKEMVFLLFSQYQADYDFELHNDGDIEEFSFDHFLVQLASFPTHAIPILSLDQQKCFHVRHDGCPVILSRRTKDRPINEYLYYCNDTLPDGRKIEILFAKDFERKLELRIGVE